MTPRFLRARAALLIAVPCAVVLSGCGTWQPGTAAVVDGRRITESEVSDAVSGVQEVVGTDTAASVTASGMLQYLVMGPAIQDAAAAAGVGVSTDDITTMLEQGSPDIDVDALSDSAIDVLRTSSALSALQSTEDAATDVAALADEIQGMSVQVNPRYGTFSASDSYIGIDSVQRDWLQVEEDA